MLVRQILSAKPEQKVLAVAPQTPVAEAVRILAEKRIGALVISSDGRRAEGILSERDIVRELAVRGGEILTQPVAELMTRRLVTCTPGDSARHVVEKMTAGRFRHMPVLEGDEMIGLISIGDVVKGRLDELTMETNALADMIRGH
ncbi:CBS domain-containing protein [Falsigemmobacter intermedius]|uniref:CBS domain-containing protein n=1 Tax=Falsigemmobacter intermedius TaxID=1553448 RepID=A0A444M9B8_9RHOB|nr:CBS domain-containing protein [Falsigemmobacter intermedius]RWY39487.1 CBS domain-containing protein [Falsigemmobacter intermedius]